MNRVTLERLLKNRVKSLEKSDDALTNLDHFCIKNWGFTFHDTNKGENNGDNIVEWLDYANSEANVEEFIDFMNKYKTKEADGQ